MEIAKLLEEKHIIEARLEKLIYVHYREDGMGNRRDEFTTEAKKKLGQFVKTHTEMPGGYPPFLFLIFNVLFIGIKMHF